jgi:two-component system, chemotaxis family, CheB/CheR fusion protein
MTADAVGFASPELSPHSKDRLAANDVDFLLVGIGASAGGLEALERFFAKVPAQSGMAFVVVQHLSPSFESLMGELLAPRTSLPIHRVEDGMVVYPNAIYLIPPGKEMIISGGKLLLTDKDPTQGLSLPIDQFFRSLAADAGRRAIAVILSGSGSDGSRGLRAIHEAGGLVVAQSPETATFDGMPRSAINTGLVDLQMPPDAIPEALIRYASRPFDPGLQFSDTDEQNPGRSIVQMIQLLRDANGIDFGQYKPSTIARRIERRMLLNKAAKVDDYADRLSTDRTELDALCRDLLIGVTGFFRDAAAFEKLETSVIPNLLDRTPPDREIRVWTAGCATGEEAYSLAMLFHEQMTQRGRAANLKIFATDVHRESLDVASSGIYPAEIIGTIPTARLERYFVAKGDCFQIAPDLRQLVVFAHHNVLRDAPFTKLDLIACRNLLIYLLPTAQRKVLSLFNFGLKTGGILFLGPSESPADLSEDFDVVDEHWKIYHKRRDARLFAESRTNPLYSPPVRTLAAKPKGANEANATILATYDALLNRFMPPSLLIDENRTLLHAFGGATRYLRVPEGRISTDVFDLIHPDLRVALYGAFHRVRNERTQVVHNGLRVALSSCEETVTVEVSALPPKGTEATRFLVSLIPQESPGSANLPADRTNDAASAEFADTVRALESELATTRENLHSTIEELETSNEELQATNEELVASNEELQSTNEELHSVNEELYTVNAEYQNKIAELTQLTNDMENLLRNTDIGVIFVDSDLRIRKFTPQIAAAFNLLPQDLGRSIETFVPQIDYPTLVLDLKQVLVSGKPIEVEVRDRRNNDLLLRIRPYCSSTSTIEGVLLTLMDISALKTAQRELIATGRQLRGILENATTLISVKDLEGRYLLCNPVSKEYLGVSPEEARGRTDYDFLPQDIADELEAHDREVAITGKVCKFEEALAPDGSRACLAVRFPLRNDRGDIDALCAVHTDITDQKRAEEELKKAVARRDQFLAMLSHELRSPLSSMACAIQLMERELSPEESRRVHRTITHQSQQMVRILDDLLDVSRVTQNKIELRKERIDLRDATSQAIAAAHTRFESRRQRLSQDVPHDPLWVYGDPVRLQQLQVNLLTNASKYTPVEGRIAISLSRENGSAVVRVRDNGVGIPPEIQQSVFELFVQSNATLDRSDGGIGVGLTLVKAIAEQHGGNVAVFSKPGEGSEFVVRIPLATQSPPVAMPKRAGSIRPSDVKIVLVEDNADARDMLSTLLRLDGYRVCTAADGESGIETIAGERPDVALIDIGLPEIDGYEVARRMRASTASHSVLLIALTGYGQAEDRDAAYEAGFHAHMVKPFNREAFARLLAERLPLMTRDGRDSA